MNPFEMTVLVVAIIAVSSVLRAKYGVVRTRRGEYIAPRGPDPDAERLREEVRMLKDRVAVLERLATDTNSAVALDREIDKLRSGH